jgi:surfactin synthase thioesterase subunit
MTEFTLMPADASKWLLPIRKEESPQVRLITFHWVGGNGYGFRPWKKELPEKIEIFSMMMPGRLSRRKENFVESVEEVVTQLLLSMQALGLTGDNQPPTVFFGHSYGGIIAYELALLLQKQHLLKVAHLVVSSTNSPKVLTARSKSSDPDFYKKFYQVKKCHHHLHPFIFIKYLSFTIS